MKRMASKTAMVIAPTTHLTAALKALRMMQKLPLAFAAAKKLVTDLIAFQRRAYAVFWQ